MKKGFTLIELLSVIVILAIIALIATPIVLNIIKNAKESSLERSKEMYLSAVENSIAAAILHDKNVIDGTYNIMNNGNLCNGTISGTTCTGVELEPKSNGTIPTSGSINITKGKITTYSFTMPDGEIATPGSGATEPIIPPVTPPETPPAPPTYTVYTLGQIIYFDPKTTNACNSTTFNLNNIKTGTSTCYKWRVIETDDNTSKSNITLMMDHNLVDITQWASSADYIALGGTSTNYGTSGNNNYGPITALKSLATATSSWTRVSTLNYTYDTRGATSNYGILTCTNGTCKNGSNITIATNVKSRLITGEEVTKITNTIASSGTISKSWTISSTSDKSYFFSNLSYKTGDVVTGTGSNTLSWLIENTKVDTSNGTTGGTLSQYDTVEINGYWTMTPASGVATNIWRVTASGRMNTREVNFTTGYGARPVITISKSQI